MTVIAPARPTPLPASEQPEPVNGRTRARRLNPSGLEYAYATVLTILIGAVLVAITPELWHWFVLPAAMCGVLIGADAVRWARSRTALFDPVGLIGVIGFHFFFVGPLLNVRWNQWPPVIGPPADWRPWLGAMALLNLLGLLAYRITLAITARRRPLAARRARHWRLQPDRFWPVVICLITMSAAVELFALWRAGGARGFEAAVTGESSLAGLGWMLAIGENLPFLCFLAWVVSARFRGRRIPKPMLAAGFGAFVLMQFAVAGLRGSRANVVWPVVIALGIVHLTVRPIRKRTLLAATLAGLLFMYFYGFYKVGGIDTIGRAFERQERAQLEEESGRTLDALLLQDLGRADIQAFILYRYQLPDTHYALQYGQTYIAGVIAVVPRAIWPNRPPGKLKAGTDLMYGAGTYDRGIFHSQNIYGLGGEALMNFGVWAIPASYIVLAVVVRRAQRFTDRLAPDDARQYLVPLVGVLCILFMTSDVGNVAFGVLQFGLLLFVVLRFGSRRTVVAAEEVSCDREETTLASGARVRRS